MKSQNNLYFWVTDSRIEFTHESFWVFWLNSSSWTPAEHLTCYARTSNLGTPSIVKLWNSSSQMEQGKSPCNLSTFLMVSSKSVRSSGWSDIAARYGCSSKGSLRFSLLSFLFKNSLKMIKMKTGVEVNQEFIVNLPPLQHLLLKVQKNLHCQESL